MQAGEQEVTCWSPGLQGKDQHPAVGAAPTASGITLTISDAFLLRAELLLSEKTAFGMETI